MTDVPSNLVPVRLTSLTEYVGGSTLGYTYYVLGGVTYKVQIASLDIGTVSSVDASGGTTGLTFSGGPVTTSGTLTLGGTLAIANGGTGSTTATLARAALLPSYAGNANKALRVNSGATDVEWVTDGGGTVTSVGQSFTGGLISVAGSPITGSGTLALTVAGTSGGIPYFNSASTWATSAALAANALVIGGGAGAAPATTTTGAGVITLLAGASSGTGGPAGTASPTFTGTAAFAALSATGTFSTSGPIRFTAAAALPAAGSIGRETGTGLAFWAITGGTSDFTVYNAAGGTALAMAVGTSNLRAYGALQVDNALTYGGVTLSNSVTGTGSMVLSASPALTGAVTVTSSAATNVNSLFLGGTTTGHNTIQFQNSVGRAYFGVESSAGSSIFSGATAYATVFGSYSNTPVEIYSNALLAGKFTSTGFQGAVGATTPASAAVTTLSSTSPFTFNSTASASGVFNNTNAGGGYYEFQRTGTTYGFIGQGNALSGTTASDFAIRSGTSGSITLSPGSGIVALTLAHTSLTATFAGEVNAPSIGATTPGTGAFTTLSASSTSSHVGAASFGTASTTQGSLVLHNTSANSVTLKSSNSTSAAYTLTLPVDDGTSGQVLSTNGSGVTSWITASGAEYGTWTPGLSFGGGTTGITYGTQTGTYVKSGRSVLYGIYIALTNKGSSTGAAKITGCPYTSNSGSTQYSFLNSIASTITTTANNVSLGTYQTGSATTLDLVEFLLGSGSLRTDAHFANNTSIFASINLTTTA